MAALKNPKHELFVRELVRHGSGARAYRVAFPTKRPRLPDTEWQQASRLRQNLTVRARIEELREAVAKRTETTAVSLIGELEQARQLALDVDNPSAAVSAVAQKARIVGLDRTKIEGSGENGAVLVETQVSEEQRTANDEARRLFHLMRKLAKNIAAQG